MSRRIVPNTVRFITTPDDKKRLKALWRDSGLSNLSEVLRQAIKQAYDQQKAFKERHVHWSGPSGLIHDTCGASPEISEVMGKQHGPKEGGE